jgi:signal transduction histidine kinase
MPHLQAETRVGDPARLEALHRLGLLDVPPQESFDRVTRLTRHLLGVPVALVTLVDRDRQFFLSADGLPEPLATSRQTPLSHSFCKHVVGTGEKLRVENALEDELVRDNLATSELGVVAYLGMPLVTQGGLVLGALCAIDDKPRTWTEAEERALADLAVMAGSELALRELASEQEARVNRETAVRLAAQEELALKRRLDALGQLAGGVAHDFANVLQTVQAGVRLAEKNLEQDPAKVRRMLAAIGEAARRGNSVTRRLLGFARRGELRTEPVRVDAVLADLHEVLVHTLNCPGLEIRCEAEPDLPPVVADRGELETVLVNLATNARDAMPNGGLLRFTAAPHHFAEPRPGRYLRLTAVDTGCGMSADTLAQAAEAFFTTKPEGQGTGLGLAMARDFAVQSGGGFAIDSELGRGTTVTLWLPTQDPVVA